MTPVVVSLVFYLFVMALCLWKPNAGRLFLGFFFLVMAWGVNGVVWTTAPHLFIDLGAHSSLPLYRTIFTEIIGAAPLFWGVVIIAYETAVGLLLLSRGARVKIGLIMGIIFLVGSIPFGIESLANAVLALALQYLLSKQFYFSAIDQIRQARGAVRS